ncbi:YcbK family protein [Prosthecobacter sp.]
MDFHPVPHLEDDETESPDATPTPQPPARRRRFLKTLFGAALGGMAGHASHPWLLGERQNEVVDTIDSFLKRMREMRDHGHPPHRGRAHPPMAAAQGQAPAPVTLDGDGRAYESFLGGLGLRHIRPMELIRPHFNIRGSVCNSLPPRDSWKHIAPALRVADELRQQLGSRLHTILSAYRSPAYNAVCPGAAPNSFHVRNMALDLAFDCSPSDVADAAKALRDKGFFKGGIGRYPTFTHIDTRGYQADWG